MGLTTEGSLTQLALSSCQSLILLVECFELPRYRCCVVCRVSPVGRLVHLEHLQVQRSLDQGISAEWNLWLPKLLKIPAPRRYPSSLPKTWQSLVTGW